MNKKKLQSIISEDKLFETGSGIKLRYNFVPALATKMFQDYITKSIAFAPKIYKVHELMETKEFKDKLLQDSEFLEKFNEENRVLNEEGEVINKLGIEIMLMILERNNQEIEITEDNILKEMSLQDIAMFLQVSCSAQGDKKKR